MGERLDDDFADLLARAETAAGRLMELYEPFEVAYGTATQYFTQVCEGTHTSGLPLAYTQAASSAR